MRSFGRAAFFMVAVLASEGIAAQPLTRKICEDASAFLANNGKPLPSEALLASGTLQSDADWVSYTPGPTINNQVESGLRHLYLAYFFSAPYNYYDGTQGSEPSGAISIKVSVYKGHNSNKTSYVELYRPAIPRGEDRCEQQGRRELTDTRAYVNEYIEYHNGQGASAKLERFHISYPYGVTHCARTDYPLEVSQSFQIPELTEEPNKGLIAQLFGGTAYGGNRQEFTNLRSELHFYFRKSNAPECVGFDFAMPPSNTKAAVYIHDLSANHVVDRGPWLIIRQ